MADSGNDKPLDASDHEWATEPWTGAGQLAGHGPGADIDRARQHLNRRVTQQELELTNANLPERLHLANCQTLRKFRSGTKRNFKHWGS